VEWNNGEISMSDLKTLATLLGKPLPRSAGNLQAAIKAERLAYDLQTTVADLTAMLVVESHHKELLKANYDDIATSYRQLGVLVRAIERE
jgi:hypothetical protein